MMIIGRTSTRRSLINSSSNLGLFSSSSRTTRFFSHSSRKAFSKTTTITKEAEDNNDEEEGYYTTPQKRIQKQTLTDQLKRKIKEEQQEHSALLEKARKLLKEKERIVVVTGPTITTQPVLPKDVFEKATLKYYQQTNAVHSSHVFGDLHILYNIDHKATAKVEGIEYATAEEVQNFQLEMVKTKKQDMKEDLDTKEGSTDDLFNFDRFVENPRPLLNYLEKLSYGWSRIYKKPSKALKFLMNLDEQERLQRVYSESIEKLPLEDDKVINCLGTLDGFTCSTCDKTFDFKTGAAMFPNKDIPTNKRGKCEQMAKKDCSLKPNILMLGESYPSSISENKRRDLESCDLVVVLGVPLSRFPMNKLLNDIKKDTPILFIIPDIFLQLYNDSNLPPVLKDWIQNKTNNNMIVLPLSETMDSFIESIGN